jgi:cytochrome oxidase Cu insertion factor (SCO1/SenC/PrrC family)
VTEGAPSPPGQSDGAGQDGAGGGPGRAGTALVPERPDRAAALAAGPTKVPRSFIVIALACVALLALGGAALDRAFPGTAGGSAAAGVVTTIGDYPPPFSVATAGRADRPIGTVAPQLPASQSALMGLQKLTVMAAPSFSLVDKQGRQTSLADFRGRVVVITFFDSACDDICPVMEAELSRAYADLGADAAGVSFVTVNTDPLGLSVSAAGPAETGSLGAVPTWQFLTGSLGQLDSVWRSYGVAVEVQASTRTVSHNEVMYFVDTLGRVRDRATPFADEIRSGVYTLAVPTETKWAAGVADEARYLLGEQR